MKMYLLKRRVPEKHDWLLLRVTILRPPLITNGSQVDLHLDAHCNFLNVFCYVRVMVFRHQLTIGQSRKSLLCIELGDGENAYFKAELCIKTFLIFYIISQISVTYFYAH